MRNSETLAFEQALLGLLEAQERLRRLRCRPVGLAEAQAVLAEVQARRAEVERLRTAIERPYPLPRLHSPSRYTWRLYEALWFAGERGLTVDEMVRLVYREPVTRGARERLVVLRWYLARHLPEGYRLEPVRGPGGVRWRLVRDRREADVS